MKTLVNKQNPQIRITAPEIEVHEEEDMYFIPVSDYGIPMCIDDWTLVEEEPKHTEVWVEGRTIFKQDAKKPEVDLEKEIEKAQEHYFALKDKGFSLDSMDVSVLARHFYELGLNARKEE